MGAPSGPVDPRDSAERAILDHRLFRDRESLAAGDCYVIAHSIMQPIYLSAPVTQTVQLTDRPQSITFQISHEATPPVREIRPPNGIVVYRFEEPDRQRMIYAMWLGAKRIRNCLSFLSGVPVPIRHAFVAKDLLMWETYDVEHIERYHPLPIHENEATARQWFDRLEASYPKAERLLRDLPPMSPRGRAVSLVGDSIWTWDMEESFLYAWRAIDVVAKLDYDGARRQPVGPLREAALAPYGPSAGETDASDCGGRVSISKKIRVTVATRAPDFPQEKTRRYNTLRGTVAHDTVDVDQLREIASARWEAQALARHIVISAIPGAAESPHEAPGDRAGGPSSP